ncbi:MAG: hypothetical protein IIT58_05940 [Treponema sp.]|nr:hypothetical protein [Treponema sp.]
MPPLTYEDLENLKNTLCEVLKKFSGDVASKKKIDDVYLKIIDIQSDIKANCKKNNLDLSDLNRLELNVNYSLEQLSFLQLEKENLTLDF